MHSRITFYVYAKIDQVNGGMGGGRPSRPPESATDKRYTHASNVVVSNEV